MAPKYRTLAQETELQVPRSMMQICPVTFDTNPPTLAQVVAEAERLGGMKIAAYFNEEDQSCCRVAFEGAPAAFVLLTAEPANGRVIVQHLAGDAPSLNELIQRTLIAVGGHSPHVFRELPLPLDARLMRAFDRKERRQVNGASLALLVVGSLLAIGLLGLAVGVIWLTARAVMTGLGSAAG